MNSPGTVAIYGVCFVVAGLVILAAGVLIAKAITGPASWTHDEVCDEWVLVSDASGPPGPDGPWTPCPHRRPCPLHDVKRGRHHA